MLEFLGNASRRTRRDPAIPEASLSFKFFAKFFARGVVAAMALCAIVCIATFCVVGCVTEEVSSNNPPPYATISENAGDPSSAPKPPPDPDEEGFLAHTADAIGTVVPFPFRLIGSAFKDSNPANK
jgi:hypothetical protein